MRSSLLNKEAGLTRDSYYEASVTRPPLSAALAGRVVADVCVVGGGYAGLTAALELAERGYSVALLEAQWTGWGASGRNGGQALVGFGYTSQEALEVQLPAADARRAWDISVEAMQLLRTRISQHAITCDYIAGHLSLAVNARKGRRLDEWVNRRMLTTTPCNLSVLPRWSLMIWTISSCWRSPNPTSVISSVSMAAGAPWTTGQALQRGTGSG